MEMAGYNRYRNYILASSLGYREERSSFHVNVHSVGTYYYSNHLCISVEREPILWKVRTVRYCNKKEKIFHGQNHMILSLISI